MKLGAALLSLLLLGLLCLTGSRSGAAFADGEEGPFEARSWNLVHRALFHRVGADGARYGSQALDPLLWRHSRWILREPAATRLRDAVIPFVADAAGLARAPAAARVVMQRDLLAAHDWLLEREAGVGFVPALEPEEVAAARRLRGALAAAARCVALSPEEARALALAPWASRAARIAEGAPIDLAELLAEDGPWLRLAPALDPGAALLATEHSESFAARSVFSVHLRLPEGRRAAALYLARLAEADPTETRDGERYLARDLPRLPLGSSLALVRRALHVDTAGDLHATPLVELVQVRTILEDRWPEEASSLDPDFWSPQQRSAEFVLDRGAFLSGESGLRSVGAHEVRLHAFGGHGWDLLEPGNEVFLGIPTLSRCTACHGAPGIHSVIAFTGILSGPGTHLDVPMHGEPRALATDAPGGADARAIAARRARREHQAMLEGWAR